MSEIMDLHTANMCMGNTTESCIFGNIVLFGKRLVPRESLALCNFHTNMAVCDATISFRLRRPAFSRIYVVDRHHVFEVMVLVMIWASDLIAQLIFPVARFVVLHHHIQFCN